MQAAGRFERVPLFLGLGFESSSGIHSKFVRSRFSQECYDRMLETTEDDSPELVEELFEWLEDMREEMETLQINVDVD